MEQMVDLPATRREFIVLTQNAFGAGPRWDVRRRLLARRITQLHPDVVGLQEVHAGSVTGEGSQAHELADLVGGYHVDFAPGRLKPDGGCEGVALLCRTGIRERSVEALTIDPGDFFDRSSQRIVLCAMLDLPEGPVDVFVTHLSLSRRARVRTIAEVLAFAGREWARSGSVGAVLMGDFNALPEEPAIQTLEAGDPSLGGPWIDAWKCGTGGRGRGATWPAIAPFRRIDYIYFQPEHRWTLRACELEPVSGSDHLGLVARLQLHVAAEARAHPPVTAGTAPTPLG
jgi:endonuclease/exonuclease/phosphatase family metal-dependent hydrolase